MALKKYIQPNSPCDLFAIRFVLFAPFLLPTASVAAAAANYRPLEKLAKQTVWLCTCVFMCPCVEVHPQSCTQFPVRWPGFSRGLPENYTLFAHHSIFPQPAGLPAASPIPPPHLGTDTVTLPPLYGTEMFQQPSF